MFHQLAGSALLLALTALQAISAPKSGQKPPVKPNIAGSAPAHRLDTTFIHKTYLDGDFDLAIQLIEDAQRYGGPFTHLDSVFLFKHLGVMHTAKYETREKGKAYMMQLLNVEPTAKIMDMYASDMIYMIFKNIKDEFDSSRPITEPDGKARPRPEGDPERPAKSKSYSWVGWTAGAVAVVGGVALGVHMLAEEDAQAKSGRVTRE